MQSIQVQGTLHDIFQIIDFLDRVLLVHVVFIADFPHNFFQQIFQRNQPCRCAVFIQHNCNVNGGFAHFQQQFRRVFVFIGVIRLTHNVADGKVLLVFIEEQILHIDNAHHIVGRILVHGKAGIFILTENFQQFIIAAVDVRKRHVNPGNHDFLCLGVAEVKHVVNHFPFFCFNDPFFMAYVHNSAEFIFCHSILRPRSIYTQQNQESKGQLVNNDNNGGEQLHQPADNPCISKGDFVCMDGGKSLR